MKERTAVVKQLVLEDCRPGLLGRFDGVRYLLLPQETKAKLKDFYSAL